MSHDRNIQQLAKLFFHAYDQVSESEPLKNSRQLLGELSLAPEGCFFLRQSFFLGHV